MDMSSDLLLWRAALSRAPVVPDLMDQLRLAQLCQAAASDTSARMLYQMVGLHRGFSPGSFARQIDKSRLTDVVNLWRLPLPVAGDEHGTVERASNELQDFARRHAERLTAQLLVHHKSGSSAAPERPGTLEPINVSLPVVVDDLFVFLSGNPSREALEEVDSSLADIHRLVQGAGEFDYRAFASAPLPLLAAATVLASLQDYIYSNYDLMFGPRGSAALLHAVARFDYSGLGPYLSNLPRVARNSQDIFELAQIAQIASTATAGTMTREHWIVLLSARLTDELRDEVVDDLGDIGAMAALTEIFERLARLPSHRIDVLLAMRIRDAALDNADYDLGARAQALLARLFPENLLELRLLGEIYASAGLERAGEQVLATCLALTPNDLVLEARLAAIRAGTFAEYRIVHGFGTPPERLRNRLLRRERASFDEYETAP